VTDLDLPAEPLLDLVERRCGSLSKADADPRLAGVVTGRSLMRTRTRGTVRLSTADRVLTALGEHPLSVFGDAYYADLGG
jgi:hypothetical protein